MAAAVETTIGTAESLTATEALFNAYDVDIQASIEVEGREDPGTMNSLTGVASLRMGAVKFKTDIWVGITSHPQWASVLFPACGYVASTNVYTPRSEAPGANVKTVTIGVFENGLYKKLAGAVGKFTINMPTGKKAFIDWEFQGVWQAPTDSALIAPTNPTTIPMRFASATCTWGGVAMQVANVTVDSGNEIVMREDPTTAGGYISALITNRAPKITADPESVLVATDDRFGQWIANTEAALAFSMAGASSAAFAIAVPKAQLVNNQEGNRNRLQTDQLEWSANKNGTTKDQEISITVTPGA
jgi:hypothetical protein